MDILEYLRKFRLEIEIISVNREDTLQKEHISVRWLDILSEEDSDKRKEKLLALWDAACGKEFVRVITYLKRHLIEVYLLLNKGELSLLYAIRNKTGSMYYYEGRFPDLTVRDQYLQDNWHKVPPGLQRFYEMMHNGFYYSSSGNMGLVPLQFLVKLGDQEWEILEEMEPPLEMNLNTSYGFFKNGMGDYLVLDLEKEDTAREAMLWYSQEEPECHLPFWDVVDEWTVLGIAE
ncbi:hypothetical protein FLA_1898 [Filimonas lacunae]|nr:hypothetical protein FLA_1898 [Filimonas lacunae]